MVTAMNHFHLLIKQKRHKDFYFFFFNDELGFFYFELVFGWIQQMPSAAFDRDVTGFANSENGRCGSERIARSYSRTLMHNTRTHSP